MWSLDQNLPALACPPVRLLCRDHGEAVFLSGGLFMGQDLHCRNASHICRATAASPAVRRTGGAGSSSLRVVHRASMNNAHSSL